MLIVGDLFGILDEQLRPHPIHLKKIIISVTYPIIISYYFNLVFFTQQPSPKEETVVLIIL
jgi:hypothetical protein